MAINFFKDNAMTGTLIADRASSVLAPKRKSQFICWFDNMFIHNDDPFLIKSSDQPSVSYDTEVLDQYNRRKIIKTRTQYNPINIRLHDDIANRVRDYFHLYMSQDATFFPKGKFDTDRSVISDHGDRYGLRPKSAFVGRDEIFGNFNIATINYKNEVYITTLLNPVVTDINFDSLDYADGNPLETALVMDYEGINYNDSIVDKSTKESIINYVLDNAAAIGQFGEPS